MEEYLQFLKTLRSQMNDVEDQAATISVEEHMQLTTIQTLEKDLESAKLEIKQLQEETEQMINVKGQMSTNILEKQRKSGTLESDSSALNQTLELIQKAKVSLSSKLEQKRTYYTKLVEDIYAKYQEQEDWIESYKLSSASLLNLAKEISEDGKGQMEGTHGIENSTNYQDDETESLMKNLGSANSMLDSVIQTKSDLILENAKVQESLELARSKIKEFKPEMRGMDLNDLEEELQALLSDKSGETVYLQSLRQQMENWKGISHVIKCPCGEEYKV